MGETLFFDTLEPRQHFTADIAASTTRLLFSGVKNKTTASQTIVITNNGDSTLKIGSGGLSIGGTDYNKFALSSPPSLPKSIAPGATLSIKVVFKPTVAGVKSATLKIKSNDPDAPTLPITLRGLGANGLYDSYEPSLQRIFNTFEIPIQTGDRDITTNRIEGPDANDAIDMQMLAKAGDGPVTFEMLAAYTGAANPGGRFGWYTPGDTGNLNELFTIPSSDVQRINPHTIGVTSFDPGTAPFALYSSWPTQSYDKVFSENALNTWETNESVRDKYRFYPLKNADGSVVENAFVVAIEEAKNNDYQDAVMIVRNVQKYVAPPLPPDPPTVDPPFSPGTNLLDLI